MRVAIIVSANREPFIDDLVKLAKGHDLHITVVNLGEPLPSSCHLLYDRTSSSPPILSFHYPNTQLLNRGLPGKFRVYRTLMQEAAAQLRSTLPHTRLVRSPVAGFLKPVNGTHGRGAMKVEQLPNGSWHVYGRTLRANRLYANNSHKHAFSEPYIAQPALDLHLDSNRVFDVRCFIQKDDSLKWRTSGTAVRIGAPGSITANLHGGGEVLPARSVLSQSQITHIESHSLEAAQLLERSYPGLAELGFDWGVELNQPGQPLWLLEVNSRPGRETMRLLDHGCYMQTLERWIGYTKSQGGTYAHELLSHSYNTWTGASRPLIRLANALTKTRGKETSTRQARPDARQCATASVKP